MKDEVFINSDPGVGRLEPGQIAFANEGRFESQYLSQPLTTYSVGGWDSDPLQQLLDFLAPSVNVPRRFSYKASELADYFNRNEGNEDLRAVGADFSKVDNETKDEVEARTLNKGLTISLDQDEIDADSSLETRSVKRLTNILLRNEIRRALGLIDASSVVTAKIWGSSADPDEDVRTELRTGFEATAVRANRVLYGASAWSIRTSAYRAQDNAGAYASAGLTPEQVGQYLAVQVATMDALYRNSSGSLATFLANAVYMLNAATSLGTDDPSNIKRFISNAGGQALRVYSQQITAKRREISVEHYSTIKITSTQGIRKFTVTKS